MNHKQILSSVRVFALAVLLATPALAEHFGATIQMGPIPLSTPDRIWSVAVPLELDAAKCSLETADGQLSLKTTADGGAWLVVEARRPGPVSGLLVLTMPDGTERHIAVAADGVKVEPGAETNLLFVATRGGAPLRRFLRLPSPAAAVVFDGVAGRMAAPDDDGWQLLDIAPPQGSTEKAGRLDLDDGSEIRLQVSLMESITTLASRFLPLGWSYEQLSARSERLFESDLRARMSVVGLRAGARVLRLYDLLRDPESSEFLFKRLARTRLPALDAVAPHRLLPLRTADGSLERPIRTPLMLRLTGERALLIDPYLGPLAEGHAEGLLFAGTATTSELRKDRLFAVRRDQTSGARYLRRWWVRTENGSSSLRSRLFRKPLREQLGVADLRALDLRSWRREARSPELPIRESLLLLASATASGKARSRLTVYELKPLRDGSGDMAPARLRYTSALPAPEGGIVPRMQWLRTPTIGTKGYPRRLQIIVPGNGTREVAEQASRGAAFTRRSLGAGEFGQVAGAGFSLAPVYFLRSAYDGRSTSVRREILGAEGLQPMARGTLAGRRVLGLRTSARGRHSFALADDGRGGEGAPYSIHLLANGMPAGVNLPPRVDAGADLYAVAPSGGVATVRLRAGLADANGDPLAVHWSARGAEFSDPNARTTWASFPAGVTQVRVRAREGFAKAVGYEGSDILDVTVEVATGVGETPALTTAIRGVHPTPANPRVNIAFTVERRDHIRIRVYDVSGHLIRELLDEVRNAGAYDVSWDGTDAQGRSVGSGVYPVELGSSRGVDTARAVILR